MPDIQYDSQTGERLPDNWRTPKIDVPDMGAIDQAAIAENIKNFGVEKAMKGIEAAIQFQGMRGYQQALKNGESSEKAMVRFGPMIFHKQAQAFAPTMKALTPPAVKPNAVWNPATNGIPANWSLPGQLPREPRAPVTERESEFIVGADMLGQQQKVRMKPSQFAAALPNLPDVAKTNAVNLAKLPKLSEQAAQFQATAPANVTEEKYKSLKSGDLFWWNGKQIPKK